MPQQETPILHIKCLSLLVNMNNETENHYNTGDLVFWLLLLTSWICMAWSRCAMEELWGSIRFGSMKRGSCASRIVPGTLMLCGTAGPVADVTGISPWPEPVAPTSIIHIPTPMLNAIWDRGISTRNSGWFLSLLLALLIDKNYQSHHPMHGTMNSWLEFPSNQKKKKSMTKY